MAEKYTHRYEELFDRPYGGTSEEKHINKWVAHIALFVTWVICKICWRFRVDNREKLTELASETGMLVVANHTSYLDVVFMYHSIRPKLWPRFIARNTLFDDMPYLFGWLLAHMGVFPIHRDSADRTAIKRAVRMLKNDEIVCILPEGSRRDKSPTKPEVHGGAALMARMAGVPILPMTVREAENIKRKGQRLRFPKVTVEFGDPIEIGDFDFLPKDKRLEGCVWYALRECFALSRRIEPEEVDMVALFPDCEDYSEVFATNPVPKHTSHELALKYAKKRSKAKDSK